MLITIENFGAIKYFQFDTEKDLYLLFGKNSVGKSYAISLVYLILKNLPRGNIIESDFFEFGFTIRLGFSGDLDSINLKELLSEISEKNHKEEIDITSNIKSDLIKNLSFFCGKLDNSLKSTFNEINNLQNKFSQEKMKISIKLNNYVIYFGLDDKNDKLCILEIIFLKKIKVKKSKRHLKIKDKDFENKIILYFSEETHFKEDYLGIIFTFIRELRLNNLSITKIYYLPASRSGLYLALSAFGQIIAELAKNRNLITKGIDIPAISEPVADYFLYLSDITLKRKNNELIKYVETIEKDILQGIVEFDGKTKRLLFSPNKTNLKIDLSATSSMVSEISPIVSYLKYILPNDITRNGKPLVFIEEPEAHLHPETQVKLIEIFVRLAQDNKIKLVITSHSNYIFNKVSNLVMDKKIDRQKLSAVIFENTHEGSYARELDTDDLGITDENFIDVAEMLYEEKIDLINKLNEQ